MLPGDVPAIIGRDDEIARVADAIAQDRCVAVVGEAGIGKTTVVRAAAEAAGRRLWEGGGFATLSHLPFLAIRRAIGLEIGGGAADVASAIEARVGPDLLFIDDLQWIDRASPPALELLRGRVALTTAIRRGDPGAKAAMALADRLGAEIVTLPGLDAAASEALVRRLRPGLDGNVVATIARRAGGNPLLLEELVVRGEAPPTFGRIVAGQVARLPEAGRHAIELLAIADRPLPDRLLGPAADEVVAAGLAGRSDGSIELHHALIGETIRAEMPADARAACHEELAEALDDPSEVARHLAAAGRRSEAAAVAISATSSGTDPWVAASLLSIAATCRPDDITIRLQAAHALDRVSDRDGVVEILAAEPVEATPDQRAGREALLGRACYALGRHDEARAHLRAAQAIPLEPSGAAAARVAIETAEFAVNVDGAVPEALLQLEGQLARHPPASAEYVSLRSIREGILLAAGVAPDLGFLRAVIEGAIAAGELAAAADLIRIVGFAELMRVSADTGEATLRAYATRLADGTAIGPASEVAAEVTPASVLAGHLAEAVSAADQVLERPAPLHARLVAAIHGARALTMLGRHRAAEDLLELVEPVVSEDWFGRGEFLASQAEVAFWGGRPDRAIAAASAAIEVPSPLAAARLMPAITRAWAQIELGLEPHIDVAGEPTPSMAGVRVELEGIRLVHGGAISAAGRCFADASLLWQGFNVPRALACRWADAEMRRRAGDPGAVEDLTSTLDASVAIGFDALAVRIRRSLRLAGVRVARSDPARDDRLLLTARERELLRLVGDGLSNIEIARRMGLGRPTVTRILSNAMSKLGVDSRAQAVAVAAGLD